MKRLLVILLLISVGLNVGLLLRVTDDDTPWASDRHDRTAGENLDHPGGEGPDDGRPRAGRGPGPRYDGLDLTEDQHQRISELRGLGRESTGTRREEMHALFGEMKELLLEETIDPAAVSAVQHRMNQVRAEVDSLVADHLLMELEVMTPEQRETYLNRMPWERFGRGMRGRSKR
jgi:Spy/CpxP family protein refolding chaperone